MLLWCAAAAWAGSVDPASDAARVATPVLPLPAPLIDRHSDLELGEGWLPSSSVDGFAPVPFSDLDVGSVALPPGVEPAPLDPRLQPAVIPLPAPLYVGGALVALTILLRRALLRAV